MEEEIIISPELQNILPPLTPDEYKILEESLLVEGCREPLILWQGFLVDGHNRYNICKKHNITFRTDEIQSNNIEDIKLWIIDNQKGRRNLTDGWKFELAQEREKILLKQHEQERKERRVSNVDTREKQSESGRTRNEIAEELGWSTGKVAMADKVWKDARPEVKEAVKSGEMSFNQAYNDIKREERKENFKNKFIAPDLPEGSYRIIYSDPPWAYNDKCEGGAIQSGGAEKHYPTMSIKEICEMQLPKIDDNAVLFLWVTSPLLEDGFKVINSWGFKYKASFIWDKIKHNMGHYNSVRHELLLIATKGSCQPDNLKLFDSVQSIERTEHSKKPHEFYHIIETLYIGNKIELFAREKHEGWTNWGNEV